MCRRRLPVRYSLCTVDGVYKSEIEARIKARLFWDSYEGTMAVFFIIADTLGKKTKHTFGIIELEDGSHAIGIYELLP
jgi:hypothetical protein